MKWIGQHIWDFISRFRSDVYLEGTETGTIASGGNLGLDSNNKIVKATGVSSASTVTVTDSNANTAFPVVFHDESNNLLDDTGTFTYVPFSRTLGLAHSSGTVLALYDTGDTAADSHIYFKNTRGGGASSDGDNLGTLTFQGHNDAGANVITYADFTAYIESDSASNEAGAVKIQCRYQGGINPGLQLYGSNSSSRIDADIGHGTTSVTTIAGDLTTLGDDISMSSANSGKPLVELKTTNTTKTTSAELQFKKDAADTEDGEVLGKITWYGENEAGSPENIQFAEIVGSISESDDGDEAGILEFKVAESDDSTSAMTTGLKLEGEHATDGEIDVTIGAGTASTTTIVGTLTMGSTAFVNNSGVIQVATQGTIDHDSLANFVANEHIDWTGDVSASSVIHTENITDLHGAGVDGSANQLLTDDGDGTVTSESELTFDGTGGNSRLRMGDSDGGSCYYSVKDHDNGDGAHVYFEGGNVQHGGATDADGGNINFYAGRPTGSGAFGKFNFYVGSQSAVSGTSTRFSGNPFMVLEGNGSTSTDLILNEKAGASSADFFKISVGEHGATTLSTVDDGAHAADLTFNVDGKTTFTCADEPGGGIVFHLDADAATDNEVQIDAGILDINVSNSTTINSAVDTSIEATSDISIVAGNDCTVDSADDMRVRTTSADGLLSIVSAHTAGLAIHIDGDADADSEVQIDAGILDINVTGASTINTSDLTITGKSLIRNRTFNITPGSTAGEYDGDVVYTGTTTGMDAGDVYYYNSSGTWTKSNASATSTSTGLLAVALGDESDVDGMLLRGMATTGPIAGSPDEGAIVYLRASDGDITTDPASSGQVNRIVGYCMENSNNRIWFDPDKTWVELA